MKAIYVVLIAIASAGAGTLIGALLGGAAGSVMGGTGGGVLGMKAGICAATETAKDRKLLSPAQAEKLSSESYARMRSLVGNKDLVPTSVLDCQATFNQVKSLGQ